MHYLGEILSLSVAVSWTVTALYADKASHRLGSLTTNVIRLVLATLFLAVILWVFIGDNKRSFADDDYKDDAARKEWESTWRTPTDAEWTWLRENCEWNWTNDYEDTGVAGMIVTGTTGNTIFLPAAGMWKGTEFNYSGSYGYYWSSTLTENKSERARCLVIYSNEKVRNGNVRYIGYSIRPVSD